jgi:hypothetical protein
MPISFSPAEDFNNTPEDDFEGLTPRLMHGLLYDFLGPGSPIKVKELSEEALLAMPLCYFANRLLGELDEKEIKLTAKGNLPGRLVKEYYATGCLPDDMIDKGYSSLRGEDDYLPLQTVKHQLDLLGWTKKRHNTLSLTKKGRQARELSPTEFFRQFFLHHIRRFYLGYGDGYGEAADILQRFVPYLTYLLEVRGKTERPTAYYHQRMQRAFPMIGLDGDERIGWALDTRLFERLLGYYGLVEYKHEYHPGKASSTIITNSLFREVFYLDPDARTPPPSEEERYEKQLKTALFDAEMGGQSWTSDDIPPELLDQFHANIRAFEERHAAGETTTVGELLGDLPLLPPEEVTEDAIAEREIERLLDALLDKGILTDRPEALTPFGYYRYLTEGLLEHEITPPVDGQQLLLTFEDVVLGGRTPDQLTAEAFLLALFNLDEPFPVDLLNEQMRLGQEAVSRERGLAHLNAWRERYRRIVPVSYGTIDLPPEELPQLPPGQAVCFFGVDYVVVHPDGREEAFRGEGVIELVLREGGEWAVSGGMFPGFEF